MPKSLIVGMVRFSVLTARNLVGWRSTRGKSIEQARDLLFSDSRLQFRFSIFENVVLRTFDNQVSARDIPFYLLVLSSELMPEKWRGRLQALAEDRPYLRIHELSATSKLAEESRQYVKNLSAPYKFVTTFRVDDDDALRNDYISTLFSYTSKENLNKVVSFERGLYVAAAEQPEIFRVRDATFPNIACGLAYICRQQKLQTIFDLGPHTRIDPDIASIVISSPHSWMRTIHDNSDSNTNMGDSSKAIDELKIDELTSLTGGAYGALDFQSLYSDLRVGRPPTG